MAAQAGCMLLVGVLWWIAARNAPRSRWWLATATAGLLLVPHVYGYDASLLLLPLWIAIFDNVHKPLRIAATLVSTPIAFLVALADKPWSVTSALALLLLLSATAWAAVAQNRQPDPARR